MKTMIWLKNISIMLIIGILGSGLLAIVSKITETNVAWASFVFGVFLGLYMLTKSTIECDGKNEYIGEADSDAN